MEIGVKGQSAHTVTPQDTALAQGSGSLDVLATPKLVAWMEQAAWTSVQPFLNDGESTVGTRMDISHEAATPIGMAVRCESTLFCIEGRKLAFDITAFDEEGVVARASHERFIIGSARFLEKTNAKSKQELK